MGPSFLPGGVSLAFLHRILLSFAFVAVAGASSYADETLKALTRFKPEADSSGWDLVQETDGTWSRERARDGFGSSTSTSLTTTFTASKHLTGKRRIELGFAITDFTDRQTRPSPGFASRDETRVRSYDAKAGAIFEIAGVTLETTGALGVDHYKSRRGDVLSGALARAKDSGWHALVEIDAYRDIAISPFAFIRPTAGFNYTFTRLPPFRESGAGPFNLLLDAADAHYFESTLGAAAILALPGSKGGYWGPVIQAQWVHNFSSDAIRTPATFAIGLPAGTATLVPSIDKNEALLDMGLLMRNGHGVELLIGYEGNYSRKTTAHSAGAIVSVPF